MVRRMECFSFIQRDRQISSSLLTLELGALSLICTDKLKQIFGS